jgi:uncharacterized Ntn-hydrolase superfamily protein
VTYSLIARDPDTGEMGVAVQSRWFAVGGMVTFAEAGVGAVATQAFPDKGYGPRALALMRSGIEGPAALEALVSVDPGAAMRQVAMIDTAGRVANYTGALCVEACGGLVAENVAAQGNMLARDGIWDEMVETFLAAEGDLAERLLLALECAEAGGGDVRGSQSSALLVVAGMSSGHPNDVVVNLRVDDGPRPIAELRRLLRCHRAFGELERAVGLALGGDVDGACGAAAQAAEILPDDDQIAAWQAIVLGAAGRAEEARAQAERATAVRADWSLFFERFAAAGLLAAPGGGEAR